jgi:enoyl-CoA hydratase/carnithine racemase
MAEAASKAMLKIERDGPVLIVGIDRPEKRNALNDPTIAELDALFSKLPSDARAVLIHATGPNFSAGLDLSELAERDVHEGILHSRSWHQCFDRIESGPLPVVAVLRGAVVGGGLELAAAAHVRIAERSAFYALPEGQRGIFVGGGGSVRVPRLIGVARMMDMMLTGRVYSAEEGLPAGFAQYLVDDGAGYAKGLELAHKMAGNAPLTNFAVIQALPRIAEADPRIGYVMESLMASVAQSAPEAKARVRAFLEKRAAKVERPE